MFVSCVFFFFFKQKTAYEMRISDWSSDVCSSDLGETVLDPFFGSGTTGAVARKLGRHYIGLERDPDYIAIAKQRIAQVQPITDLELIDAPAKRAEPRIPFGWLLEPGLPRSGRRRVGKGGVSAV